ncbi:hypothetical protein CYANOKiyG1_38630 [Okeania sp. KiyG1]|nr:hypothetical protein CYANOKiyG1_38630 [Okeania sp. KiyG1]
MYRYIISLTATTIIAKYPNNSKNAIFRLIIWHIIDIMLVEMPNIKDQKKSLSGNKNQEENFYSL